MINLSLYEDIEELMKRGNLEDAENELIRVKQKGICDDKYFSMYALLNICMKDYKKAIKACQVALQINIDNSKVYFLLGIISERQKSYNMAYIYYEHAEYLAKKDEQDLSALESFCQSEEDEFANVEVKALSIVLIANNNIDYTKIALESIKRYNNKNTYEIVVVDYNSTDKTKAWLSRQKGIKVVTISEERGLLSAFNEGLLKIGLENDVLLLTNDCLVLPNSILNLRLALYRDKETGAVGPISNRGDKIQLSEVKCENFGAYVDFASKNNIYNKEVHKGTQTLSNFAFLIKGEVLIKVGLLNEKFTTEIAAKDDFKIKIPMHEYGMLICRDSFVYRIGNDS